MSSFRLNNGFRLQKTNRAAIRWKRPPKKPFHHVSRDKILHDSWSISGALARGFSDRHFERGEGLGDEAANAAIPQEGSSELIPANDICEEEGSEHDDERAEEESALQSERPVLVRTPRDRRMGYGEWFLSSLQQIVDRTRMLEEKQTMERDRIKKQKPKLLKNGSSDKRTLIVFLDFLIFVYDLNFLQ